MALVFGSGFRGNPANPGWGLVCVCLCARSASTQPFLTGVCGACVRARVVVAARHFWLGVWCGCVCVGLSFRFSRRSWLGCWGVYVCLPAPPVPGHSRLRRGLCVCVLGTGFWLGPAIPGGGVGVCVFVCAFSLYPAKPGWNVWCVFVGSGVCFHSAIPRWGLLVCVFVCAVRLCPATPGSGGRSTCVSWVRFSAAPSHSLLGCSGVCACVRALHVRHQCWLRSVVRACRLGFWLSPRLSLLRCWGVYVCVRALPVPCQSCPGCAVCLCVVGFRFRLRPVFPGWGVGMCVFVCALRLYPADADWGSRSVCVWSGFGFHPANPGSGVGVLVFVCALCLSPASAGCDVRCPRLCLGSTLGCAPPFLAEVLECVSLCACFTCTPRILAGGRGACVLVLVLAVTQPILARALGCVCLCARSACTPPLLAAVCGVGVCARV